MVGIRDRVMQRIFQKIKCITTTVRYICIYGCMLYVYMYVCMYGVYMVCRYLLLPQQLSSSFSSLDAFLTSKGLCYLHGALPWFWH
jgi:hypothetical protein